jgi:hypothetical protein
MLHPTVESPAIHCIQHPTPHLHHRCGSQKLLLHWPCSVHTVCQPSRSAWAGQRLQAAQTPSFKHLADVTLIFRAYLASRTPSDAMPAMMIDRLVPCATCSCRYVVELEAAGKASDLFHRVATDCLVLRELHQGGLPSP